MLKTLRNRLILSHVLPMLVTIPLVGIALVYLLETQFLLPSLTRALAGETILLAEITRQPLDVWQNPSAAEDMLLRVSPNLRTRVMLFAPDGRLLASSEPEDKELIGKTLNVPGMSLARTGQVATNTDYYSTSLHEEVIDSLAPVRGPDNQLIGIVRMTYRYASMADELLQMRYLIAGILVFGLLSGAALGSVLALSIANPLRRVTRAVYSLVSGEESQPMVEGGPEEIRLLVHAVNFLVDRLKTMEQSRRQLLANLVHELGRPIGAIRSATQALTQGAQEDPELRTELLKGLDDETQILQRLLEDLAQIHKQVLGKLELQRVPLEISQWLPGVIRTWQEAAAQKHIHWETEIPSELPKIQADPVRLAQVIGNLVSNAVKFTPVGGRVQISAGRKEDQVWIRVSDTGPGIPIEEQTKIFVPYYRGRFGRRFPQGMGLGLPIARDLVTAHGGTLEMDSAPGLGTRFTVWLPIQL
jgi:signal transduction histidine kinase